MLIRRWEIERFATGAGQGTGTFSVHTAIPRPGVDPFNLEYQSQAIYQVLADGTVARIVQDRKANLQSLEWRWSYPRTIPTSVLDNLYNQLKEYERLDQGVRITMHTGDTLKGYFVNVRKVWKLQGATQTYEILSTFQSFDVNAAGFIMTGSAIYI